MMTSSRPYLIRAMHEWILDNGLTPYILVNTKVDGTFVPEQYIRDDKITLNISHAAIKDLFLGNEEIEFSARFGGKPMFMRIPVKAVSAVYAKESGVGMAFQDEGVPEEQGTDEDKDAGEDKREEALPNKPPVSSDGKPSRPTLRIVK